MYEHARLGTDLGRVEPNVTFAKGFSETRLPMRWRQTLKEVILYSYNTIIVGVVQKEKVLCNAW